MIVHPVFRVLRKTLLSDWQRNVFGKNSMKTTVIDDTRSPVWNEVFKLKYNRISSLCKKEACLHLSIWDKDLLDKDDYIGQV